MDSRRAIATDSSKGAVLTVHVLPKASRTECVGIHGDALKIRVAAPPVDGAANEELVRFIADRCAIPRTAVFIQSGAEGRRKRLRLKGISAQSALARLAPEEEKGVVKA
ncbi:MAG: DUF167 domain-containing protein [Nitrospiraceae bacterium]